MLALAGELKHSETVFVRTLAQRAASEAFLAVQLERGFRTLDFYKQLKL